MTVYRIQSKQDEKRGAYCSHVSGEFGDPVVRRMQAEHDDHEAGGKHPTGKYDTGIERRPCTDEHCGFDSAAKLLRWFKGFVPDLLRAGYEIVALCDVTVTAVGEYQVLFKWECE